MTWSRRSALAGLASLPMSACGGPFMGNARTPPDTPDTISVRLPPIIRHEFGGAAQLYMVENHRVPLVSLAVTIQAGFADDPPGKAGVARMVGALLVAKEKPHQGDYADLGTSVHWRLRPTSLGLGCTVHRDDAPAALRLLVRNFRNIASSLDAFEATRRDRIEALAANRGSLQSVGGYSLVHACLGVDPAAAALSSGSLASLASIGPDDVTRWIAEHVRPSRVNFAIAGDLTLDQAFDWIVDATADWQVPAHVGGATRGEVVRKDSSRHGAVLVPWPGTSEAIVSYDAPTREYAAPDELEIAYADGFVRSAISDELRQRQRAAYGIDVATWSTRAGDIEQRLVPLAPEDVEPAIAGIRERLQKWHDNTPWLRDYAQRGLESTRLADYVSMMQQYDDNDGIVSQLMNMADVRLPVDSAHRRFEQLQQLDGDRIARAIVDTYHPDRMRWSVVADPRVFEGLESQFRGQSVVERRPRELIGEVTAKRGL